eukprot:CAMPEP_0119302274 /NCGR_PEP_ID=MMETSP1333-20130426/3903_1 /TAXON_ID=418940 /ORGANISM="Scyphosphaera apsteinii, Strain RCC1455" /LENGTH=343 /DNA_ID=CAMNT_0007304583 /DNA_START=17 /DNA_END=1048 /DNA_ORIENTATION=-
MGCASSSPEDKRYNKAVHDDLVKGSAEKGTADDIMDAAVVQIHTYLDSARRDDLLLLNLTSEQRAAIHKYCDALALHHYSVGSEGDRRMVIRKPSPQQPSHIHALSATQAVYNTQSTRDSQVDSARVSTSSTGCSQRSRSSSQSCTPLDEISNLSHKRLTEEEVFAICDDLTNTKICRALFLHGTSLTFAGCTALANVLQLNDSLTKLSASHCNMGLASVEQIAAALSFNVGLIELELNHARLKDEGACAVAKALGINFTLETVSLQYNLITDVGALCIATALSSNGKSSVRRVDIDGNDVGTVALAVLNDALPSRPRTQSCNIGWTVPPSTDRVSAGRGGRD